MAYNPDIHHRRSIRLKGYDYAQAGAYFITLCTHHREHLFGKIAGGKMILNEFGQIAYEEWAKTPQVRPNVSLDVFVIMPNHMHGILLINSPTDQDRDQNSKGESHSPRLPEEAGKGECDSPRQVSAGKGESDSPQPDGLATFRSPSHTVGAIVRGYKSAVTRQIQALRPGGPVWQRNYYEHIIRHEKAYHNISAYIIHNPDKWQADTFYT